MSPADADLDGRIRVRLAALMEAQGFTVAALAEQVGITEANLGRLKNGHGRAIRFTTLAALCRALDCQPGDLFSYHDDTART